MHRWISTCFDVRSSCTSLQTSLSHLQECFFISNSFLQKFDVLFNIEDFLKNLNKKFQSLISSLFLRERSNNLFQVCLSLVLRHLFFLDTILKWNVHLIPLWPHVIVTCGHQLITWVEQFIRLRNFAQCTTNIFLSISSPSFRDRNANEKWICTSLIERETKENSYVLSTFSMPS